MAIMIAPEHRKIINTTAGAFKSRYAPERVRLVERVCWFIRADRKAVHKILKSVKAIGKERGIGYGQVWEWTFEEADGDYSVFAPYKDKKILMKTIPLDAGLDGICGYKRSYGGWRPPYWHPAFQAEVAMPC